MVDPKAIRTYGISIDFNDFNGFLMDFDGRHKTFLASMRAAKAVFVTCSAFTCRS